MFNSLVGVPLPWTPTTAFTLADANADNFRVFNHFFDVDRASSAQQVLGILNRYEGIPWVNTIVADKSGHALYADIGAIPNVSNAKAQQCDTALGAATFAVEGLPILDGSRSACNWGTDPDAIEPGLFGPSHLPHLFRSDYVTNSNDSYWLSNPHQPLTGFARIIGTEGTARTLRTRIGLIMTQARVDGSDHLGPPGFTRQDMQNLVFSDIQYGGELVRDDLVGMCRSFPLGLAPTTSGPPVQVGSACNILAAWDLHENLNSNGAVLFRRFWDRALAAEPSPWSHPFDASDPVHTPYGLNTSNPMVRAALGDAINDLDGRAHPARRRTGRRPVPGRRAHPAPRRPRGSQRGVQRHLHRLHARAGVRARHARLLLRAGRLLDQRRLSRHANDPHLLGVFEPVLIPRLGPDGALQPQAMGAGALLLRRRPRATRSARPRSTARPLHPSAGRRLGARRTGAGVPGRASPADC